MIIIDTPPVMSVTDAQVFMQYVKYCLLVIDTEKNNKNDIKKAKQLIEKAHGQVIGAVLNKTAKDKSSNYYYYYGDDSKND